MKILMVTTSYPRNSSDPSGIFIKRLACALVRTGAKITVLAPGDPSAKLKEWDNGIRIIRFYYAPRFFMKIAYGDGGIPENLRRVPWLFLVLPLFLISLIIYTIVLARDCDVLHVNWVPTAFFTLPAKTIRRKPVVVTVRGMDFKKGISTLGTLILRTANVITTINQKWAEDIKEKIGGEVFYTPNGVEVSENKVDPRKRFGINSGKIIVLYVGVLSLRKGADILARVAELTIGRNRSIQFLVVGPGNPKEFGLEGIPNVTYAGGIPPDEVLGLYAQCDIFALPSRHEGRPNSLLEAMASGLPSVATNLPGVIEILNNESGIIIDTENSHSFSEAILELAQNQERRRMMGQKAVSRIKELSLDWNTCANNYLRIFKEVTLCAE